MTAALAPMEAKLVAELPDDPGWQFEPKWDGFRALVFRDGGEVEILSKSGKSLARYFPEIVTLIADISASRFVLDGELILRSETSCPSMHSRHASILRKAGSRSCRAKRRRS